MSPIITPTPVQLPDEALRLLGRMTERRLTDHALNVAALTTGVCRRLRIDRAESETIALAALLHDVGKLVIAPELLDHPGPLSFVGIEAMRRHPGLGERLLRGAPGLEHLASLVRHSHERWDGTGYPDGLRALEIPLASRIIAACDAWDAMRSDRVYRARLPLGEALSALHAAGGSQVDARVVSALAVVVADRGDDGLS